MWICSSCAWGGQVVITIFGCLCISSPPPQTYWTAVLVAQATAGAQNCHNTAKIVSNLNILLLLCGNSLQLRYKILQIKCRFSWLSWCTCRCGHSIFVKHVNVVTWNLWQVIGPSKQAVSIHTYACMQCSHTSMGLTLARLIYWSILNAADVTQVFRVSKTLQKIT